MTEFDRYLEQAIAFKNRGWYTDAIAILKGGIDEILYERDFDNFFVHAKELARCYYLNKDFGSAIFTYEVIFKFLCIVGIKSVIKERMSLIKSQYGPEIGFTIAALCMSSYYDENFANYLKTGNVVGFDLHQYYRTGCEWIDDNLNAPVDKRKLAARFKETMNVDLSFGD